MPDSGYNQFCPVAMAAEILGARWTLLLLRELLVGSTRFNDLRRGVPRMSPALLSKRLKDLEIAGIVTRCGVSGEPGVFEYQLTAAGRDLQKVVEAVGNWGQRWVETETTLENLDPDDVGHPSQHRSKTDAAAADHDPNHLQGPRQGAAKLVAHRATRPGGRPMLCRSGV